MSPPKATPPNDRQKIPNGHPLDTQQMPNDSLNNHKPTSAIAQ